MNREGMARYGIVAEKVFGCLRRHPARPRQATGQESRPRARTLEHAHLRGAPLLAAFVDDPALVTSSQMNAWCKDFDNWAVCDTVCFHLFDRSPLAYEKVVSWATRKAEFEKRAAFALLASLALHDKRREDAAFLATFALVKQAASDERNFVKKAVSWALKGVGQRSLPLHQRAVALARELSDSSDKTERWIGKDALRDLTADKTLTRLERKKSRPASRHKGTKTVPSSTRKAAAKKVSKRAAKAPRKVRAQA